MKREEIKQYWDNRAREQGLDPAATTDDVYLRELEIATLIDTLKELDLSKDALVLDVGCGDGYSTLRVAADFPQLRFSGVDYSADMIARAQRQLQSDSLSSEHIRFAVGDVTKLGEALGQQLFDVAISDRCLINLESQEIQASAIGQIANHLKPGGYYIAIENFSEGHDNMNRARHALGLPEIPVRWHNLYFDDASHSKMREPYFKLVTAKDFSSSYYFATRVVYSAMCKETGEKIDYRHPIHRLAPRLPWTGQFSPVRMIVLQRRGH
jgi:ubiquinone/menaquinone biosynthesis C-methylase UbiE